MCFCMYCGNNCQLEFLTNEVFVFLEGFQVFNTAGQSCSHFILMLGNTWCESGSLRVSVRVKEGRSKRMHVLKIA